MNDLVSKIFSSLRLMDQEAQREGIVFGLNDYGRFARPESKRPQCEVEWSRRLATLLASSAKAIETEKGYSSLPGKRCDLYCEFSGQKMWMEVKGSWRDYWNGKGPYRSHLLNPLLPGLDATKTNSAALDLVKLDSLQGAADWIAELIIGFERPDDPMDEDIAEFVRLANLNQWQLLTDSWQSALGPKQVVRCFLWFRSPADHWDMPGQLSTF